MVSIEGYYVYVLYKAGLQKHNIFSFLYCITTYEKSRFTKEWQITNVNYPAIGASDWAWSDPNPKSKETGSSILSGISKP